MAGLNFSDLGRTHIAKALYVWRKKGSSPLHVYRLLYPVRSYHESTELSYYSIVLFRDILDSFTVNTIALK